uniref:Uncharacterized protein C7D4.14c n=1 Tax=Schizosaccharomyces pombe TaxID=4896 RepID=UPI002176F0C2|nr:Chain A, Uncharacterized protein C7D4.14c [Schizosaccharomyces pombe]
MGWSHPQFEKSSDAVEPSVEKEYKKIISFRDTVFEGKHQQFLVPNNVRLKFLRDR